MVLKQLTLKILHSLQMIQHLLQSADLAERTADMDEFDRQELDRLARRQRNPAEEAEEALSIDLSDIKAEANGMEAADIADKSLDVNSEIEDDIDERIRDELEDIGEETGRQNGTDND
jgi:hypothetical protein